MRLEDLTVAAPPVSSADWNDDGVVVLKNFLPESLMQAYEQCWEQHNGSIGRFGGWPDPVPYTRHKEIRDLLCWNELTTTIEDLIGEPPGLHLNLTGWVSTQRDWHQDSYLNPGEVGDFYAAVWIAFETINPNSGPFQYVPGSHRWPQVTREKILNALDPELRDHRWPKYSESILTPLFTEEIENRGIPVVSHLPERGDVLIWHGRILHRGSAPKVPGMPRRSLIAHYSGINHRSEMPKPLRHNGEGYYFPIVTNLNLYYGDGDNR